MDILFRIFSEVVSNFMNRSDNATVQAFASYLPEKVLTNDDLSKVVDTSDEWIVTRTGIRERRIASDDQHTSTMGALAAQKLLKETKMDPLDIDLIIVTTMTPDYLCPSTAALIQSTLGATNAAAFDLEAACSGFIYGLATAKAFVESGTYSSILLISSEKNSSFIDYTDRNTCILFGDGAGACLIKKGGSGLRIGHCYLGASGKEADLITIPAGGSRLPHAKEKNPQHALHMNGKEVFKHAVRKMEESMEICLKKANVPPSQVRWFIPHQANQRIIESAAKRFGIPKEKTVITIDRFANTSAATIPVALDLLWQNNQIAPGDNLLLAAVGGGLTWGASLLQAT